MTLYVGGGDTHQSKTLQLCVVCGKERVRVTPSLSPVQRQVEGNSLEGINHTVAEEKVVKRSEDLGHHVSQRWKRVANSPALVPVQ